MNFLKYKPVYRCAKTDKRSTNFIDVLPQSLTIDSKYIPRWLFTNYRTLFKEVAIVPPEEIASPEAKELFKTKTGIHKETKEQLLSRIKAKLEEIVFEKWRPDMFHIHLHSSGLDSRILSWTIRNLYKKHGPKWLGDMLFICSKWEGKRFKEIMQYEGWRENQYYVVDEQLKDDEYFAPTLLNFEGIWRETNGPQVKFNNIMWYLIDRAQKQSIIPEHIQLWTSQWGNEALTYSSQENGAEIIKKHWEIHYLSAIGQSPHKCDELIEPYANIALVKLIITSSVCLGGQLRPQLLEAMDKQLFQFIRIPLGGRRGPIADWILEQMLKNYQSSWYGKNVFHIKEFPKLNEIGELWAHYIAASLCEYLLKSGYQIRKGKWMNIEGAKQDLFEIKEVLDNLKIKFWLTHGTLLGAVRDKNFIKTDRDMDIRILAKDWSPKIKKDFEAKNFRCRIVSHYPPHITKLILKKHIQTDLALEYYYPPDDAYICLTRYPDDHMTIILSKFYKGDCFINFLGKSFRVPNPPEELLEWYYGESWRTPTEEFPGYTKGRKPISLAKYLKYFSE